MGLRASTVGRALNAAFNTDSGWSRVEPTEVYEHRPGQYGNYDSRPVKVSAWNVSIRLLVAALRAADVEELIVNDIKGERP